MTKNNFKAILFGTLMMAMLIPTGMNQAFAESMDDPKFAQKTLQQITPYITVNDDKTVTFDRDQAREDGLSKKVIKSGTSIVEEQNALITGKITDTVILKNYFSSSEFAAELRVASCNWSGAGDPTQNLYSTYSTTLVGAQSFLSGIGYHNVAWYALHPGAWGNQELADRDHQTSISAFGCESGVFRTEALIVPGYTVYNHSTPEPNPEYLDNSWEWPVWYWPVYVADWHNNH